MTAPVFADTNVLVYARDAGERVKQPLAAEWLEALWRRRLGKLSYQVLSEYYITVTRKLEPGLPVEAARADVRNLMTWSPLRVDGNIIEGAFSLQDRFSLSWWDSLIVSAAQASGAGYLLTEDLQDGQVFDQLVVLNPFRARPEEFLLT